MHLQRFFNDFFCADLNEDDVRTYTFDASEGNNIFCVAAEQTAYAPGTGNDEGFDTSIADVEFDVAYGAEDLAVTGVDDILVAKLT